MSALKTKTLMIFRELQQFPSKSHLDEIPFIITNPQKIEFVLHFVDEFLEFHTRVYKYKHHAIRFALLHAVGDFQIDLIYVFSSRDARIIREYPFRVNNILIHED